jgi:hypothetical protein
MFRTFVFVAAFIVVVARSAFAQPPASAQPAVPLDAVAAIADAFKSHSLVALGATHGHRERQDFLLRLAADARFAAVANDIVVEGGSSSYQPLVDRFVSGEDVPPESLRRAWRDTPGNGVDMLQLVRAINSRRPKARHLRVLLGEPPIDADRADPDFDRNRFAARLIEREVLARRRRALLTYGSGHFVRKAAYSSLVTVLERGAGVKIFSIWTSVTDLRRIDADLESWPVPSLALVRDTPLGSANFAAYVPSTVFIIPPEWQVPMQDQFDAVLYLGETATWTFQAPGNAGAK